MAALSNYFPPKVLQDINVFRVGSPTELNGKLVALQRVIAAALFAYLFLRYRPAMQVQWAQTSIQLAPSIGVISLCLAYPTVLLTCGGRLIYTEMVNIISGAKHRDITCLTLGLLKLMIGYYAIQIYSEVPRVFFIPNTIDNLFIKIANKYSERVWNYFYEK